MDYSAIKDTLKGILVLALGGKAVGWVTTALDRLEQEAKDPKSSAASIVNQFKQLMTGGGIDETTATDIGTKISEWSRDHGILTEEQFIVTLNKLEEYKKHSVKLPLAGGDGRYQKFDEATGHGPEYEQYATGVKDIADLTNAINNANKVAYKGNTLIGYGMNKGSGMESTQIGPQAEIRGDIATTAQAAQDEALKLEFQKRMWTQLDRGKEAFKGNLEVQKLLEQVYMDIFKQYERLEYEIRLLQAQYAGQFWVQRAVKVANTHFGMWLSIFIMQLQDPYLREMFGSVLGYDLPSMEDQLWSALVRLLGYIVNSIITDPGKAGQVGNALTAANTDWNSVGDNTNGMGLDEINELVRKASAPQGGR